MNNKSILITGGLGNIGSFIVDEILSNYTPERIIIIDNLFNGDTKNIDQWSNYANLKIYKEDISNYKKMERIFQVHKFDYVFHLASTLITDSEKMPQKAIDTNISGLLNIIQLCNEFNIKKISYSSSASVFGEPQYLPVDEEHPFEMNNNFVYGWTKIAGEMLISSMCKVPWNGFRYYNVYSERTNKGTYYTQVIRKIVDAMISGDEFIIYGDGLQTMDLIHAVDVAKINVMAIMSDISGEFFNVGTGISTTLLELVNKFRDFSTKALNIEYRKDNDPQKVKNRRASILKCYNLLDWRYHISVDNGIKRVLKHWGLRDSN